MKKIISLIAFIAIGFCTSAQTGRGIYGTKQAWTQQAAAFYSRDTAVNTPSNIVDTFNTTTVDTAIGQWTFMNNYDFLVDVAVTKVSGTVAGSIVLQGSLDNLTWNTITGATSVVAGGIGASATITNTTGTKHYQWHVTHSTTEYPYYQVQGVLTGTCAATFNPTVYYQY